MHQGRIESVSRTPLSAAELQNIALGSAGALMQAAQSAEPLYRIKVSLNAQTLTAYGQPQALKPGAALEADVLQDKRKIWEWVFEPVLAARVRAGAYLETQSMTHLNRLDQHLIKTLLITPITTRG
jgi:hypothetical protein